MDSRTGKSVEDTKTYLFGFYRFETYDPFIPCLLYTSPLDDRTLLASIAAIVNSQFGERTDNGVAAVTTRNQIPDLRLFMGFLFRNKYLTT